MIESRYKIEYVLPEADKKDSSSFKALRFLLLIPFLFIAVTAVTYDFSWENIKKDSLVLAEKAKIHVLNLGEVKQVRNKNEITQSSINDINTATQIQATAQPKETSTKLIEKQETKIELVAQPLKATPPSDTNSAKVNPTQGVVETKQQDIQESLDQTTTRALVSKEQQSKEIIEEIATPTNEVILKNIEKEIAANTETQAEETSDQPVETKTTTKTETEQTLVSESISEADKIIQAMSEISTDTAIKENQVITPAPSTEQKTEVQIVTTQDIEVPTLETPSTNNSIEISTVSESKTEAISDSEQESTTEIISEADKIIETMSETSTDIIQKEPQITATPTSVETEEPVKETVTKIDEPVQTEAEVPVTLTSKSSISTTSTRESESETKNDDTQTLVSESISEADRIIEAMSDFNLSPSQTENEVTPIATTEETLTTDTDTDTDTESIAQEATDTVIDNTPETSSLIKEPENEATEDKSGTELAISTDTKEVTNIETEEPEASKEVSLSPVDDIIAAMQEASSVNNTNNSNVEIDPELEKDIKKQLVEQGDLSIDDQ